MQRRSFFCWQLGRSSGGRDGNSTTLPGEPARGLANSRRSGHWDLRSSSRFAAWVLPGWFWLPCSLTLPGLPGSKPCGGESGPAGLRWALAAILTAAPIWFLQYTPWGVAIHGPYVRVLIWCISGALIGRLVTPAQGPNRLWLGLVVGLLLAGTAFAMAAALTDVTSYPFSLGWSEGNRLWDYSLLFGKSLYEYNPASPPVAYLDIGRQITGGLPFLLPQVTILGERLWLAILGIAPYVLLGAILFWPARRSDVGPSILAGVWCFIFLNQGAIHSPLLLCAILVALAWKLPIWPAAALVGISSYFAEVSRFTWMFAPALWAGMLQLAGSPPVGGRVASGTWFRAGLVVLAGLLGAAIGVAGAFTAAGGTLGTTTAASTSQALLWYRLLPNATYGSGILLGLAIAVGPLLVLLAILEAKSWQLTLLQKLAIILPALAFLAVGLIVSTKIGGGGDLHNLDMFLIGLAFAWALAWRVVGPQGLIDTARSSLGFRVILVVLVAAPAYQPLMSLRPLSFAPDAAWLSVLADVQRPRDLGSLPTEAIVSSSLEELNAAVEVAQSQGDVLFMDQRQLLTFGNIRNVRLIPEYEKKLMMDQALSANRAYFQDLYADLAAHRFSLIVSSPLRTPIKDSDYGFGEENNAWVQWVATPILCYYAEQDTLTEVKVELLVPRNDPVDCSKALP